MNDTKTRPKSYRTSGSKTYTDTLRELIQVQMSFIQPENSIINVSKERRNRSRSKSWSNMSSEDEKTIKSQSKHKKSHRKHKKSKEPKKAK
jgi:hypothetical protein